MWIVKLRQLAASFRLESFFLFRSLAILAAQTVSHFLFLLLLIICFSNRNHRNGFCLLKCTFIDHRCDLLHLLSVRGMILLSSLS